MVPFPAPYPTMEEERAKLRRSLKKLCAALLIGFLIFGKIVNLATVHMKDTNIGSYLSISGILFIAPFYYIMAAVNWYNVFRVCACGAMLTEAAQFFLFLGVFRNATWVVVEVINIFMLCLLLTIIEELFEQRNQSESLQLTDVTVTPRDTARSSENVENQQNPEELESYWSRLLVRIQNYYSLEQ